MSISGQAASLLTAFVEQQMRVASTPGVAVATTDRQETLYLGTHGLADLASAAPITAEHLFEIGSISKSFTAIALLQLWERGLIDLHAPVAQFLPWFEVPSSFVPITLHHLLTHTAGIINGSEFTTEARYEVWALRKTRATASPGARFHYSNVGFKVLGLVLEELLDQRYPEIIQEEIMEPLAMHSTEPQITHDTRKRLPVGYVPFYDDRPTHRTHPLVPATWLETATADGSIASTAADMAAYLRMLLNCGQGPQVRVLSEESFRLMTQRHAEPRRMDYGHGRFYGYGISVDEEEGHTVVGHGGGMVGYCAFILGDLDDGLGVVVLVNGPGEPAAIARFGLRLLRACNAGGELPPLPPEPEPTRVESPADYAGRYRQGARTLQLVALDSELALEQGGERIILEPRGEDCFFVPHPGFARFLLRFGREEGLVVEACHGPDWYANERYAGPSAFDVPHEWAAYSGHFRSHNPWYSNFRVVHRKEKLFLVMPWGDEEPLVPVADGEYRVGADEASPERLRFGTTLGGRAICANLSGCDYYRTFTA
jgi:CubicO group peptidase (beta-lactamase class C family)